MTFWKKKMSKTGKLEMYKCEKCHCRFGVDTTFDRQYDVCCPVCLFDLHLIDNGIAEVVIKER